jgi:hypothetical protein
MRGVVAVILRSTYYSKASVGLKRTRPSMPPVTSRTVPVVCPAIVGEDKNKMAFATSTGKAILRMGNVWHTLLTTARK